MGSAQSINGKTNGAYGQVHVTTDGETTLSYFATNTMGAFEAPSNTLKLKIDTTPPTTAVSTSQIPGLGVSIVLVGSDTGSGVKSIQYQVFTMTTTDPMVTFPGDRASLLVPATGLTEVAYWATDNVGNVETMHSIRLQPWLALSQPGVSFGSQLINAVSSPATVSISNTGGMALTVNSVTTSSEFKLATATSGACPAAPFTLATGASCSLGVSFAPTGPYPPGPRTGFLTVKHNGANGTSVSGTSSFALDGVGIGIPHLTISQSTLQFSSTPRRHPERAVHRVDQ